MEDIKIRIKIKMKQSILDIQHRDKTITDKINKHLIKVTKITTSSNKQNKITLIMNKYILKQKESGYIKLS